MSNPSTSILFNGKEKWKYQSLKITNCTEHPRLKIKCLRSAEKGPCATLHAEHEALIQPHFCSITQSDLFLSYCQDLHGNFSVLSRLRNLSS